MNRTSSRRGFIASAIASILFFVGFGLFQSPDGLKYACGLFSIGLFALSMSKLGIADIVILEDSVAFVYCFAKRIVSFGELAAVDVFVGNRGPIFLLATSDGRFRISYTRKNLLEIRALLQRSKASRTTVEVLDARVRAAWRAPAGR